MFKNQTVLLLVEDFLLKEGLLSFLKHSLFFKEVIACGTESDFEKMVVKHQPNFVLISGQSKHYKLEKIIAFVGITSQAKMIVMAESVEKIEFEKAKQLGVVGFLLNQVTFEELNKCFKAVKENHRFVSKEYLIKNQHQPVNDSFESLNISVREIEIIKLIAEGFINKEIADKLFLSTHTVNTHRKNIMQKLGINNTAGIVLFAVKERIISPDKFLFQ